MHTRIKKLIMRWEAKPVPNDEVLKLLQNQIGVSRNISIILAQRGINNYDRAKSFFRPQFNHLHDPFLMKDMKLTTDRIEDAIKNNEKIFKLYKKVTTTVHNKKQNVIKKRWLKNYSEELENLFYNKVKNEIGDFRMDNLKDEKNDDILGLFQESYNPIGLHVDAGFNLNEIIYKQTLMPLTSKGSTVIFKNKIYGNNTNLTIDENELKIKNIKYGQKQRNSEK